MLPAALLLLTTAISASNTPTLVFSVNCGGGEVVDANGIAFHADPSMDGVPSDYGRRHPFPTVHPMDQRLYQTERYAQDASFSYTITLPETDGEYAILFRFAEVYFDRPGGKVFNVLLNGQPIISNLDIFKSAGGLAKPFDTVESFKIQDGNLVFGNVMLDFHGELEITFAKGRADNPKCNAFALFRGKESSVPRPKVVVPQPVENDDEDFDSLPYNSRGVQDSDSDSSPSGAKYGSGPRAMNPYENQDPLESIWPLLVAIPCLIPIVYVLLKMK